ncbi:MAG: hypothetical protein RNU03_12410 [Candidatus Sedimenticola sp. (ex Thyasira tokunagai)]
MGKTVKLSTELVHDAAVCGKTQQRSIPKQIEYWARMGKIADENPEIPLSFVKDILIGIEEIRVEDMSEYQFG